MKSTIRIPTTQYGYIEVEFEGTAQEIISEHNRLVEMYGGNVGLTDKEFNDWLDKYNTNQTGDADQYAKMSVKQTDIIQANKRSFKRIKSKLGTIE